MNNIKNKVHEKIKEYSNEEYLDGYIKNEFLTEDGTANILLKISSINELFDPRTCEKQLDLRQSIYDFVDHKSSMLDNNIELKLNILGIDLESHKKEQIKHLFKEHYAIELYKLQKDYKRYKNRIFKLLLTGLLSLICYSIIALKFNSNLFIEISGFLFSFALWQAFEIIIYNLSDLRKEREAITQKLIMDIIFDSEKQ